MRYKNLEHIRRYYFSINRNREFENRQKEIISLFDRFEKNIYLCPLCERKVFLGRTGSNGYVDVCCKCGWVFSDSYSYMLSNINKLKHYPKPHRHTYKKMTVGSICVKCGHWK